MIAAMSLIDHTQFSAIVACGEAAVRSLLEQFKEDFVVSLNSLREALDKGEDPHTREVLHQYKGTSATFGLKALSEKLGELEHTSLSVGELEDLQSLCDRSIEELYSAL